MDIENYEGSYQVSNKGRIKSLEREVTSGGITRTQPERILTHWCGKTSLYDCVRLYKNGIGEKFSVHRNVAAHFLDDWDPELEVTISTAIATTMLWRTLRCVLTSAIWSTP